ncbi:hypothetical protein NUW58_g1043 [Xylaria curta]|uniref:Uncharacterized protein n=1 Tax=Xylaria curta TaxID=42375 RepID=A0ACC1PP07_9PEZI|nr:hypothetical protein NUW58_g1043 [Xylaria curta]
MRVLLCLVLAEFVPIVAQRASGQFFNPPDANKGEETPVYYLGKTQTIKFTTIYPNYAINLWQENPGGGSAVRGPAIFSTEGGAVTQFDWQVQAYQFDLSVSDVFFLWLTSTSKNEDGSDPESVSSHYFKISSAPDPSSTTSTSTHSSNPTAVTTKTSATGTSTSLPPIATSSDIPVSPSGLDTGAKAGIGVGVGLAVLAGLVLAFLFFRCSRKRRGYRAPHQPQAQDILRDTPGIQQLDPSFQVLKPQSTPAELESEPVNRHNGHAMELLPTGHTRPIPL